MITVYHANRAISRDSMCFGLSDDIFSLEDARTNFNTGNYNKVAEVSTRDLDEAYRLTNHIHRNWEVNPEVVKITTGNRSTSVGDILEAEGGKRYIVDRFGFKELS